MTNLISQVTRDTMKQRARKSKQLDNIEVDRLLQRMRDAEERRKWRQEKGRKGPRNKLEEPPLGLGKTGFYL